MTRRLFPLSLLLLACGGLLPVDTPTAQTDCPPRDWSMGEDIAALTTLALPAPLAGAATQLPGLLASAGESDAALCAAVSAAQELPGALVAHIDTRPIPDDAAAREIERLGEAIPGVLLTLGAEGIYSDPDWSVLAEAACPGSPAAALLTATHGFLGNYHHVTWIDWSWDLGGCANLARPAERLAALAAAWDAAPPCLRAALKPRLTDALGGLGRHACYCEDAATIAEQAAALYPVLDALTELGGPAVRAELEAGITSGEAVYEDQVCGG